MEFFLIVASLVLPLILLGIISLYNKHDPNRKDGHLDEWWDKVATWGKSAPRPPNKR